MDNTSPLHSYLTNLTLGLTPHPQTPTSPPLPYLYHLPVLPFLPLPYIYHSCPTFPPPTLIIPLLSYFFSPTLLLLPYPTSNTFLSYFSSPTLLITPSCPTFPTPTVLPCILRPSVLFRRSNICILPTYLLIRRSNICILPTYLLIRRSNICILPTYRLFRQSNICNIYVSFPLSFLFPSSLHVYIVNTSFHLPTGCPTKHGS